MLEFKDCILCLCSLIAEKNINKAKDETIPAEYYFISQELGHSSSDYETLREQLIDAFKRQLNSSKNKNSNNNNNSQLTRNYRQ